MKSSSAVPDFVPMSLFEAALEASLRPIRSATMAGSVSSGAGAPGAGAPPGLSSGSDRMKFPRSRTVSSASLISGSDFPRSRRRARPAGEARCRVTSTNSLPPASYIGRRAVSCQTESPRGLHGVGHHLLMTDGDVDVVLLVAGLGDRKQRRDRPALNDLKILIEQTPFDVLRAAEVRFDPPAQLGEPNDLRIRQGWLRLPLQVDRLLLRPTCRRGVDGKPLGGDRLGDDLAVPHLVDVRVHHAGDQGLAEAEGGLYGGDPPASGDGIGREQDAGRLREDHLLHDHGHADAPRVEAVPQAVGHGSLGEERGPAPADVPEDSGRPHDVQVRVLLAREGCRRQVLRRRARPDGASGLLAEPDERAVDRRRQIVRDGDRFERSADVRAQRADRVPVVRLEVRQPIEPIVDRPRFRHDPLEGGRRDAKASRHADAFDPRKLPQVRALAADERELRLVDLLEKEHVAAHPVTLLSPVVSHVRADCAA